MPHRFLLIEEPPFTFRPYLVDSVSSQIDSGLESVSWRTLVPERLHARRADIILPILIHAIPQANGFFQWLRCHPLATPVLAVIPEQPEVELFRSACETVDDFVVWPVRRDELRQRVARLLGSGDSDSSSVQHALREEAGLANLVGRDPAFLQTIKKIPRIALKNNGVLITGETGTGKELCARAIHHLSSRRNLPFIPVDCAAIPDHLFENELFGHARGAFTDAHRDQKGLVGLAEGGTLFLDEVDSLSLPAQAKVLRLLQERIYRPLGSDKFARADVNVISATNRDLESLVRDNKFRADLYFRLDVIRLHMVPLRERRSDIPLLARHFAESMCGQDGVMRVTLASSTLQKLVMLDWPGNVRQLYNVILRAVASCDGPQILPSHIYFSPESPGPVKDEPRTFREAKAQVVEAFQRTYVQEMLRKCNGNVTRAACLAGKERRAFGRLVKRYQIV